MQTPGTALVTQQGGCGKTPTAVNLSASVAVSGRKTLLIDLDPQANATFSLGVDPAELAKTIYHVLVEGELDNGPATRLEDIIRETKVKNLYLAPSSIDLAAAGLELAAPIRRGRGPRGGGPFLGTQPHPRGAQDYMNLAKEVMAHEERTRGAAARR